MSDETLIAEGQDTNTASGQQTTAAATTEAGTQAPGTEAAATEQKVETTAQATESGQKTPGVQDDTGKPKDDKPEGAPEAYDFKLADDQKLDPTIEKSFAEVAKELNLPQDKAQKVLDKMAPALQARQAEAIKALTTDWGKQAAADKEFGGEHLGENLSLAKKALDTFGTPELKQLLNESGFGNHPEVIRLFVRAGKAISDDRIVTGNAANGVEASAKRLYAKSNMN